MISCGLLLMSSFLGVLLGVAYFTLLERKILAYSQTRKGPNKVGLMGLPQPILDAIKLFSKEYVIPRKSNKWIFWVSPFYLMSVSLGLWSIGPGGWASGIFSKWSLLFFLCASGASVYGILMAGWSSNCKYALFGAVRAMAQVVSYEVVMVMVTIVPSVCLGSFSVQEIGIGKFYPSVYAMVPLVFVWFIVLLAETHRAPFDFAEGESELVSGYNVEYSSIGFVLIFMAEYASVMFMSYMTVMLWWGVYIGSYGYSGDSSEGGHISVCAVGWLAELFFKVGVISVLVVLVRASFPRYRYDLLMMFMWKSVLPLMISFFLIVLLFSVWQ